MTTHVLAVVVAAGSGRRLGAHLPKALVQICGRPLVWHAVTRLLAAGAERVVVTAPSAHVTEFDEALEGLPVRVIGGGQERQDSVRLGADALGGTADDIVLIHDAARPLVPREVVQRVIRAVADGAEAVVPVLPVNDSIRAVGTQGSNVVDRDLLRAVQTPQGFRLGRLQKAHAALVAAGDEVTDDATAVELDGGMVSLVDGDRRVMKVTDAFDLACVRFMVEKDQGDEG